MARRRRRNRADYNRAVDLIMKATATDEFNESTPTGDPPEVISRVMVKIKPASGNEATEADKAQATHTHMIFMPRSPSIEVTTEMAIRYDDEHRTRIFDIAAIGDEHEDHDQLVLLCVETK